MSSLVPEFRRELIRLANRERLSAIEVGYLVDYGDRLVESGGEPTHPVLAAEKVFSKWMEPYDDEP